MHRVLLDEMPVKTVVEVPLDELPVLTAHEEQLLAGMCHPVAEEAAQPREFLPVVARHFADERALSVHDLIVRERQDEVLGECVHEREGEFVLIPLAVDRVEAHIVEHVVHPTHVPLVVEPHAAHVDGLGDQRPRGGLLSDHECLRMILEDRLVEFLQELHRLEIARVAVFVWLPLAVLASVVEVKHIRDRVDAQAVDVELLKPEQSVRDEEALHLRAPVVKVGRAPLPVLRALLIVGLVEILSVKMAQSLLILAEVPRHPVHDDADAIRMGGIDEVAEIVGRAVAARHGEVARRLIPPRPIVGVLAERHELNVGIVHLLDIADELIRHIAVGEILTVQRAPPRARVHLVREHGTFVGGLVRLLFLPRRVLPLIVVHIIGAGCGLRFFLRIEPVGIRLHNARSAPLRLDGVLVDLALAESLDEGLPDLTVSDPLHGLRIGVPVVESADNTDGFCIRRPHGKTDTAFAVPFDKVRAQHFLCVIIRPLMKEIKIKLTECRRLHKTPPICPRIRC